MTRFLLIFALAATAVMAQAQSTGTSQQLPTLRDRTAQPQPAAPSTLPASQAIITIHGLCSAPAADPSQCTTVISRDQFEKLLDALNSSRQPITPEQRRNLAQSYVELMTAAQAAEKAGVANDPKFAEVMRLVRLRTLADLYRVSLEEKYRTPSADELQDYYNRNQAQFEEFRLSRILIPAKNPLAANKLEWETKAAQLASTIHDRAAKGESFEQLQKEAYATLGLKDPPSTVLTPKRRSASPSAEEQEVFALQVGGVSPVEQENNGNVIYRMEVRQVLPLDSVKDQIAKSLARAKVEEQMKGMRSSVHADFNGEYFGAEAAPAPPTVAPTLQRPAPPK
jgi:hypothetical protein